MLYQAPVITKQTKAYFTICFDKYLPKGKSGATLQDVVAEVLHDRNLFTFLAAFLPQNHGLILGKTRFYNDIAVQVTYGLTVDFDELPRQTRLFTFETYGSFMQKDLHLGAGFPSNLTEKYRFEGYPTPEEFAQSVNTVLQTHDTFYLIQLDLKKKEPTSRSNIVSPRP